MSAAGQPRGGRTSGGPTSCRRRASALVPALCVLAWIVLGPAVLQAEPVRTLRLDYFLPATERTEPWEPNVTALLDPAALKWRDLVAPDTPMPTPWNKEAFEQHSRAVQERRQAIRAERRSEGEMDALFREQQRNETAMLRSERFAGRVGAFEGAMYEARGYYRPAADCIMFTRNDVPFCAVCRRALARVIDLYTAGRR